jgi:hypothetical protein
VKHRSITFHKQIIQTNRPTKPTTQKISTTKYFGNDTKWIGFISRAILKKNAKSSENVKKIFFRAMIFPNLPNMQVRHPPKNRKNTKKKKSSVAPKDKTETNFFEIRNRRNR